MSGLRLVNFERPGRVIDRAVLVCAVLAFGCTTRIGPVPAGLAQVPASEGVVAGHFEEVGADGEPGWIHGILAPVFAVQVDESFGKVYEIELTGAISDFSAPLPAGTYRWRSPCSNERVTFAVFPGKVTYLGTLRIERPEVFGCRVSVHDDAEAAIASFRAARPELGAQIEKHLMVRWDCTSGSCEPVFAPDPR